MTAAVLALPIARAKPAFGREALWATLAAAAFHTAYLFPPLALIMIVYQYALVRLTKAATPRRAFYSGLAIGMLTFGPQLWFFVHIFHYTAPGLWLLLSMWTGFFVLIGRSLRRVPGIRTWAWMLALPVIWTGLEYFRSELYYLKFAWLTPGIALSGTAWGGSVIVQWLGVYGAGFALMLLAAIWASMPVRHALLLTAGSLLLLVTAGLWTQTVHATSRNIQHKTELVVCVQLEAAMPDEIIHALNKSLSENPFATLFVMSEYSLDDPPPPEICHWCQQHQRYLIIGGKQPLHPPAEEPFADTAFVIDPTGKVIFSQGKSVPIQFFADGVPAKTQRLWDSPWGKIGICICYDLSYTRVTDELIRQGAQLLIVPSMDAAAWGAQQHELHARIAIARAQEYHVPIVRVGSSGISQIVAAGGTELARGHFPGQGESVAANLWNLRDLPPHLPVDRKLAMGCVLLTAGIVVGLWCAAVWKRISRRKQARG